MTIKEFRLPDVGEGVAEGELVSWLVSPGDRVEEDQPVAEVETDKALVEVPSSYDGLVEELFVEEGDVVPVGDVIISFRVDEDGEAASADDTETAADTEEDDTEATDETDSATDSDSESATPSGRTFAPPSARRLARELGVDIGAVEGSGPGGRISEADVRAHAEGDDTEDSDDGPTVSSASDGPPPKPAPTPTDTGSERKSAVNKRGASETDATGDDAGATAPADRDTTLATPATRKVARELGVDIDDVPTDERRDGEAFVTGEHVRAYAEGSATDADSAPEPKSVDVDSTTAPTDTTVAPRDTDTATTGDETIPYRGVRRTIGKQMERSKYTAPHVTHHDTVAVDALVEAREELKPKAEAAGVNLTFMPFVMKAIVAGLKAYPSLNSELREDDEEIVLKGDYNLGIAVATDAGLMVPVVENVDEKGLFELAEEVSDLASRARERKITAAEMQGGTFSITNFGAIGGEYATPIINYPETAILGLGAIEERPVARDGEVVAAPTLPLSLSIDHRVIDGAVAAEFANTVMDHLEHPLLLLTQ